ncbi:MULTISPECIES: hypothetical protein [Thermoanaerobacterium]|uniref:Uncharacterized protein n=3 Tax=Thermoanaerobacterium TaxID=28895 RepID=L0INK6_THETR|nr:MULTISPECIES: hypothetical protein [Thermoanaerobacterium]AFK94296.1 hypothetical protein Tsac_2749 [Thermoanaerobacterium saccharolyticum JW/SL-YS485]AGB20334.1 hypothetical protein Thethe_02780 [Thermoanaerobacterium thermosaccharolyticum M0795]ETO37212.1 hypothetical protein V518_2617 [Thermoanaerobacterium aotearoense SCUT27]
MSNLLVPYLIIAVPIIVIFIIAHYTNKLLWLKTIIYFTIALILIISFGYQYTGVKNSFIYPIRDLISNVFLPVIALDEALISLDKKNAKKKEHKKNKKHKKKQQKRG